MLYFRPKLYVDNSGYLDSSYIFVRVGTKAQKVGGGIMFLWQRVRKIFPGIYVGEKSQFFDYSEMFSELK